MRFGVCGACEYMAVYSADNDIIFCVFLQPIWCTDVQTDVGLFAAVAATPEFTRAYDRVGVIYKSPAR